MQTLGDGWWACPRCEAGRAAIRLAQGARAQMAMANAQIPRKFAEWDLDSWGARTQKMIEKVAALRRVREWVEKPSRPWLFVCGGTGRGKTGLACGALKALALQGRQGYFVCTYDMFDEMKARFGGDEDGYKQALAQADVLVLDELVAVQQTTWRQGVLFELILRRDAGGRTTIFTSYEDRPERVSEAISEAGWRRVRDNSLLVRLEAKEIDWGK